MPEGIVRDEHLEEDIGHKKNVERVARREVITDGAFGLDEIFEVVDKKLDFVFDLEDLEFAQLALVGGGAVFTLDLQPRVLRLAFLLLLVGIAVRAVRIAEDQPLVRRQDLGKVAGLRTEALHTAGGVLAVFAEFNLAVVFETVRKRFNRTFGALIFLSIQLADAVAEVQVEQACLLVGKVLLHVEDGLRRQFWLLLGVVHTCIVLG